MLHERLDHYERKEHTGESENAAPPRPVTARTGTFDHGMPRGMGAEGHLSCWCGESALVRIEDRQGALWPKLVWYYVLQFAGVYALADKPRAAHSGFSRASCS